MTATPESDIFMRRVCLRIEGMDAVGVRRDVPYGLPGDGGLVTDVYYPPSAYGEGPWPMVIIVAGYAGTMIPRPTPLAYKDIGWTTSTAQLIAMSGMAALAYTNRDPVADLHGLLDHVRAGAAALNLSPLVGDEFPIAMRNTSTARSESVRIRPGDSGTGNTAHAQLSDTSQRSSRGPVRLTYTPHATIGV